MAFGTRPKIYKWMLQAQAAKREHRPRERAPYWKKHRCISIAARKPNRGEREWCEMVAIQAMGGPGPVGSVWTEMLAYCEN